MEAGEHAHHHHHELPTSGSALNAITFSATLHCLTGCAIGEVAGMVIGTALGFSEWGTIALAVALAFLFGYTLTSLPLLRAGLTLSAVVPIALATDTFSIAVMEIVDNAIMLLVPGAMEAGLGNELFWGALSVALVVAGVVAFPVNRWLITRGKGHAVLHNSGHHPNFPTRLVAVIAAAMAIFGTTVLVAEAASSDEEEHSGGSAAAPAPAPAVEEERGPGLALDRAQLPRGERTELSFRVLGADGEVVRDFEVQHEKRLHLILVRHDMQGFQHLHPRMDGSGRWSTPVTFPAAGRYRVIADFVHGGVIQNLGADVAVDGPRDPQPLPPASRTASTPTGYRVLLTDSGARAGEPAGLRFDVTRGGRAVQVGNYLGAKGHLVALREGDLAYVHTHPAVQGHAHHGGHHGGGAEGVGFETQFPAKGRYRLFFQFKHAGAVHTAAFTRRVAN